MRQLWINGKRMDSITLLRREFTQANWDLRHELGSQLNEQCRSGALASWLNRQPELDAFTDEAAELCRLREELNANGIPSPALLSLLSGVPEACFQIREDLPTPNTEAEKLPQLQKLSWWDQAAARLRTVSDWTYVVLNREQLTLAMRKHRSTQAYSGEGVNTIYLCNTGTEFWLDLRAHNRDLRFVGLGSPSASLDPRQFFPAVDLAAQNLYFEDLNLTIPAATQFFHLDERCKNVHLIR